MNPLLPLPFSNKIKINKSQDNSKDNMTVLKHHNKPVPRVVPSQTPPSNLSNIQLNTTSYSECFSMALKFNNPFEAFIEIQKAFGLTVVELPDKLKNDLKPEF